MAYQQCSQDALQFKGVFMRNLATLVDLAQRNQTAKMILGGSQAITRYESFIHSNAEAIWTKAACTSAAPRGVGESATVLPIFGVTWIGPCNTVPGAVTAAAQASALDALLADMQVRCRDKHVA